MMLLELPFSWAMPFVFYAIAVVTALLVVFHGRLARFLNLRKSTIKAGNAGIEDGKAFLTPAAAPTGYTADTLPRPQLYRPFRHGPNFITMGIRKLDWSNWIQMDSYFLRYHDLKASELKNDFHAHVKFVDTPNVRQACLEVFDETATYLTSRYPKIFELKENMIHNAATDEQFSFPATDPYTALSNAALLVQDDLIIMAEEEDGQYHLDAAAVCLPGFWRLKEKYRMSLDELHIKAGVPHYTQKLQKSLNRFFKAMTPDNPVTRNNYFIQLDDGLHWSHRMGDQNGNDVASWAKADGTNLQVEDLHFRSERQTLRRLPKSGALLFTVRTYFEPICKIAHEPHIPGRLAEAIRAWDDTVSEYKGKDHWEFLLLPYLDEQQKIQETNGISKGTEEGEFPY